MGNRIMPEMKCMRSGTVIRFGSNPGKTRVEIGKISWREDLLAIARLLDRLVPDHHDPELFHVQKNALAHELRRLARRIS